VTTEAQASQADPALAKIVPRWEWRTFGEHFGDAEGRLALLDPQRVQDSEETYFLSLDSDASVKVREALMDVKELQGVNADGLEQWRPILKGTFPLAAADVGRVLALLGLEDPQLTRDTYSLDQLIRQVVRPSESVVAVTVQKHREHYSIEGCMTELSTVTTKRGATRTIAIESEDPALVVKTVRELGLADRPNVCLARGLKTLLAFEAVRYAVIDVGTNSVKFHVGEHRPSGAWRTIVDRAEVTRLGEGLEESGRLAPEAVERTAAAITAMAAEARSNGAASIAAVGTAGLRVAPNADALVELVRDRCGVGLEVISGEDEARLAYLAATSALGVGAKTLVLFDSGGGSTQFTFGHGGRVDDQFSVDVGAVRVAERFGLSGEVSADVVAEARQAIASELSRLDEQTVPAALIGLGGTLTNLAAVAHGLAVYDPEVVQGTTLGVTEIDRQIELYRTTPLEERRRIVGLQPKRAEVILAGACIVRTVLDELGCTEVTVSDRGLRHGVLVERFS
jgi:exopolyphosphatase/guanosine-5'-triphosphate,3'-diphosphate pyrophosphatase